jgi:hypothetical protein
MAGSVQGGVEELARESVRGWAVDTGNPSEPLLVELLVDEQVVASARADLRRPDLEGLGHPRSDLGFVIPVPAGLALDVDRIAVRIAGTAVMLPIAEDAGRYEGVIERVTAALAGGWAWRVGHPLVRPRLEIRVDGRVVAQTAVGHFREDLVAAGVGDGRYGFYCDLPRLTPEERSVGRLQVVLAATGTPLFDLRPSTPPPAPRGTVSPKSRLLRPSTPPAPRRLGEAAPKPARDKDPNS